MRTLHKNAKDEDRFLPGGRWRRSGSQLAAEIESESTGEMHR
jgi:hypothetical protein